MSGSSRYRRIGYQPRTEDEIRFCRVFDDMFAQNAEASHRSSRDAVSVRESARLFFRAIEAKGDGGYHLAGQLFYEMLEDMPPHRETLSRVLTALARQYVDADLRSQYVDADGVKQTAFPESRVHHIGRLISGMHPEKSFRVADALVQWCEDMNVGLPAIRQEPAMPRQETAVIRGSIMSTSIDQGCMRGFWQAALPAKNFPWRMFSDPCRSERGVIFATTHVAAIAKIFSFVTDDVVKHIATWMVGHAVNRRREERPGGTVMPYDVTEPATPGERRSVFKSIVHSVEGEPRRSLVGEIFAPVLATA